MASLKQKLLSFVKKHGHYIKRHGRGLIKTHALNDRFKKMTLHEHGMPAHKKANGGTIRHHHRPYNLKESAETPTKHNRKFSPIVFRM